MTSTCYLLLPCLAIGLTGCVSTPDAEQTDVREKRGGLLLRIGAWLAEDPNDPKTEKSDGNNQPAPGLTHKLPVGSVHLVQGDSRFVLIQSSRTLSVRSEAVLFTYDSGGRPTGKLKLSPERKSGFLVADIVEGNPQRGDRVLLYDVAEGRDGAAAPESPGEVLE